MTDTTELMHKILYEVDTALRTLFPPLKRTCERISPAETVPDHPLNESEKKHSAGLMRVNHAGEVCAQALYQGQALTATLTQVKETMQQSAREEIQHLAWCEQRLTELESTTSLLNVFWYTGAFCLGAMAGLAGDSVSLGFVAETENQVASHLQKHLQALPLQDEKSKIILEQMLEDEKMHAQKALQAGGMEFPTVIKKLMAISAKIMTTGSYYF